MTHVSNFGSFGRGLAHFADLQGYLPEPGDSPEDFEWDDAVEWDSVSWTERLAAVQDAMDRASENVVAWQGRAIT